MIKLGENLRIMRLSCMDCATNKTDPSLRPAACECAPCLYERQSTCIVALRSDRNRQGELCAFV